MNAEVVGSGVSGDARRIFPPISSEARKFGDSKPRRFPPPLQAAGAVTFIERSGMRRKLQFL